MKRTRIAALLLALVLCLGLLPVAAMAEEEEGEFTITFDPAPGRFTDNSTTRTVRTTSGESESTKHLVVPPAEIPVRSGYTFKGWYVESPGETTSVANRNFTEDTTVKADWELQTTLPDPVLNLDPNGGTCSVKSVKLNVTEHTAPTLDEELPVPTRSGYSFQGWYSGERKVAVGDSFSGGETATAKWAKIRTSKINPSLTASPSKIEEGAEKVELVLSCGTSGVSLDWRPLERALYSGSKPSDWAAAAKSLLSGNFSDVGLKLTKVSYRDTTGGSFPDYPYELYPEGVCPADGLTLTLEGEAKAGTLNITLAPGIFVQLVGEGETETLTEASADIFKSAKVSIPVGDGKAASKDGLLTVKFDLNYKDPKQDEIPKEKTVVKGDIVGLPDGSKLTPPASNYEFYAWAVEGKDGKLYPWKESNPVTEDMTLYAGWVKKGTVVKDGQGIEAKPAETQKPAETAKPSETTKPAEASAFTDVAPTSPFAPAIAWAVEKGITNGTTPTTFAPGTTCTTGHILTFLWRSQGSPEPTIANPFKDEIPGAFQKAAVWAHEKGLVSGDTFGSAAPCTRAASVTYMWKLAGSPEAKAASFKDVDASSDYAKAISWAVEKGVTNGTGDGTTFSPENTCTRGQIVTFLYRAYAK